MAFAAAAALALVLWLVTSPRWFSFYGLATVLLAAALPLGFLLWHRLDIIDWKRAWAFVFIVPALFLGLIQIGYWVAYFTIGPTNPTLGIVREMVRINAGQLLPLGALAIAGLWAWLFWRTATELP